MLTQQRSREAECKKARLHWYDKLREHQSRNVATYLALTTAWPNLPVILTDWAQEPPSNIYLEALDEGLRIIDAEQTPCVNRRLKQFLEAFKKYLIERKITLDDTKLSKADTLIITQVLHGISREAR